ncbi:MAG: phosphoenolpyruvate synthase [Gammaproteobacteria bacterium CG11_big_fil_rev_8_21_14_0_20_46_22]|nr:MAG: phosphoenolpyruvate synthase [Gammaproteobacteria bacterium CG12_big_fil_rev_8_21_14_0_65_46_12]PIR12086.1 MAG: phosphoenolpyruvate synthase [Gammaproteobacteria bacterium CG11_big_fil_rev_8_21_14_0_20_46_22]
MAAQYIKWFNEVGMSDVESVGGKNASLGEMTQSLTDLGVQVPFGFATTAQAYRDFVTQNDIEAKIDALVRDLDVSDVKALAKAGQAVRGLILDAPLMPGFEAEIADAFKTLSQDNPEFAVAVRSSATAEDLDNASFAGQQETYLNVRGIDSVLTAIKNVFASLYNDRAIAYRVHHKFDHASVAISVGVQQMVRSDLSASGVMFTLDTESGFDRVMFITSAYGLGEAVVQGSVNPDEFYVYKPNIDTDKPAILRRNLGSKLHKLVYAKAGSAELIEQESVDENAQHQFSITDDDVEKLAHYAKIIEAHYKKPMDIEWAKDGLSGELFIVQARPETVNSQQNTNVKITYKLETKGKVLAEGRSVGQAIGQGRVCLINDLSEMDRMKKGDVLVTEMTDPDWEPIMSRASAIVTNRGGRTCHAAIIARELGIPAVVGCGDATDKLQAVNAVTVSCAEGDTGFIYEGELAFEKQETALDNLPELPVKIMLNVGNPDRAFAFTKVPNEGVGLARLEFIVAQMAGIHPRALLEFDQLRNERLKQQIAKKIAAYRDPVEYYVAKLTEGMATIAAAFYPKMVIFRLSDFKSNEYANLLGGTLYEPHEENPMLGFRGASRYVSDEFKACFALECEAVKRVREKMGLDNANIMIPFVRTLDEAKAVHEVLEENGLRRGEGGLKVMMMCEIPSNALLADQFLEYFDGFSIGSNDLTQLTLGLDRDSSIVSKAFDERNPAVKCLLKMAIDACKKQGKYVGICGQGPSDHPDLAEWLCQQGIESLSLNPDSVIDTMLFMAK